ncbi:AI-2E family transporter [Sphingobacterium paucimobilis]|uniref:Permease n=1 Tax=Sphingobacterium paucimobilis HER1398 TaxID=1346330 RepID=U2J9G5_9SPHI|nr:AI-2E family transporter [Sphingobacterium paucimobilis]ERJ59313.1 hypothetical protein M472_11060 [Sphingobacterium paucimobilis HER1398]
MTNSLFKGTQIILLTVLSITILYFGKEVLAPLAMAGILAMLFLGPSTFFEKKGMPRWASALIAIACLLVICSGIIFLLNWQLQSFAEQVVDMKKNIGDMVSKVQSWIESRVGIDETRQKAIVEDQMKNGTDVGSTSIISTLFGMLVDFILVLVYIYLLLFYRSRIKAFLLKSTKSDNPKRTLEIVDSASTVAASYVIGLAKMILTLWILYGIGFTAIGVENAFFFAIICGLLELIPFIGNLTGTAITLLGVMAQGGETGIIVGVIGIYAFVQFVQTYLLEPLIVGDEVNINALFTILSLVIAELIWGIPGMVIAIPCAGIMKIVCDRVPALQPIGYLIGSDKKIKYRKR